MDFVDFSSPQIKSLTTMTVCHVCTYLRWDHIPLIQTLLEALTNLIVILKLKHLWELLGEKNGERKVVCLMWMEASCPNGSRMNEGHRRKWRQRLTGGKLLHKTWKELKRILFYRQSIKDIFCLIKQITDLCKNGIEVLISSDRYMCGSCLGHQCQKIRK